MPLFAYSGFDRAGARARGTIEAPGRRAALARLREQGVMATEVRAAGSGDRARFRFGARRITSTDLALLTRQLATLIGAGLPLDEALAATGDQQEKPRLQQALAQVRERTLQGETLHAALATEDCFPPLCVNMVAAGEAGGHLDRVLEQLADYFERMEQVATRLRAALTYPLLMLLLGSGVLFFLITFVLPKMTRMLLELDRALPWPTALLIGLSNLFASWWWLLALLLIAGLLALRRYFATEAGALWRDERLLRLPLGGRLLRQVATARFARTLAALLEAGVALTSALEIAAGLLGNRLLQRHVADAIVAVREGGALAAALDAPKVFPPILVRLTAAGEQSGELEPMLQRAAAACEQQADARIAALLAILQPALVLGMGVAVGFIVLAILLPIIEATQGF